MNKSIVYLGCPYSHDDREIQKKRFEQVTLVAAKMVALGIHVFSPITQSHVMRSQFDLPGGWEYWEANDRAFLSVSDRLVVLKLDGWEKSVGLQAEIKMAESLRIPILYIEDNYATSAY